MNKEYYFGVIEYCKNNNLMEYIDILNDFYTCIHLGRVSEIEKYYNGEIIVDFEEETELEKKYNEVAELYSKAVKKKIEYHKEIERLYKELKIKTDFIEELLYLILNSTDNKLQKEVHKIGVKYDKNIQKLKGSDKGDI